MSGDHYFSEHPTSADQRSSLEVELGGRVVRVNAATGTFSSAGLDRGTAVLLRHAPAPPVSGTFVDLGCGWGPIALHMALLSPDATVWAVDVNKRALSLVEENASALHLSNIHAVPPESFPDGTPIDLLWSNPPIRIGKVALHELLATWCNRLSDKGEAWMVVSKNLGADSLSRWINEGGAGSFTCQRVETARGFRVLKVSRPTSTGTR